MQFSIRPITVALLGLGASFPLSLLAASDAPEVVVTATRFADSGLRAPANILTVTREEIAASGAQNVPDVLRHKAVTLVKPLYGSLSGDTAIDMRGFGDGGAQRVLVLLNGQRLNPLDTLSIDWGMVPLEAVERIEVMSGSGSVLFGDNAVGGVINIITDTQRNTSSVQVGAGSYDARQVSASLNKRVDQWSIAVNASTQSTDGWRRNNWQERDNANARVGYHFERGEAFVDLAWSKNDLGLPGTLNLAQYRANPRQPETQNSAADRTTSMFRPGVRWAISDTLELAAEVAVSQNENHSWLSSWPSFQSRKTDSVSFTPRLQWKHGLGSLTSASIVGVDYYQGDLVSRNASTRNGTVTKTVRIDQASSALYAQNRTELTTALSLTTGVRHQTVEQSANDSTGLRLTNNHEATVGDLGLSYQWLPTLRLFARTGSTIRYANLDELTTFTGFVNKPVRPEQGNFVDLGSQWTGARHSLRATVYRLTMRDEITYNNATSQNENMAKTLHQGLELDGSLDLSKQWQLNGGLNLQHTEFLAGADRGKNVPLVPHSRATLGVSYKPDNAWTLSALTQYVSDRYYGGDTANRYAKMPSYATTDLVVSYRQGNWTARGRLSNAFDKRYTPTGYNYGSASVYPADGRTFFADVRLSF